MARPPTESETRSAHVARRADPRRSKLDLRILLRDAVLFILQAVTGMFLALYYAPTPDHAYDSVRFIETDITLGWFVRGLHHWGAFAMVVAIGLHMLQTFL